MYLKNLRLWNFRSYETLDLNLENGTTILLGENGVGKTNVVEAIYLLCTGRSHRDNRESDLIKIDTSWARVRGENIKRDGRHTVDMVIAKGQKKRILVNGLAISKTSEMLGHVSGVIFSPEDLNLVKEGPSERRRFMNIELSQVSRSYFYALAEYNKVLEQRNKLLALGGGQDSLAVWDTLLAQKAVPIIKARREFCQKLDPIVEKNHFYLSGEKERLSCKYKSSVSSDDIFGQMMELLENSHEMDMRRGFTSYGPHKDDIVIRLGDIDLRYFGSQGQQRTATLALKLSELEMMREDLGEYPILLLDDVLSELDERRQKTLLDKIKDVQTIITAAQPVDYFKNMQAKTLRVTKGKIEG